MKFITTWVLVGAVSTSALAAQTPKASANPVSDTVRQMLAGNSTFLVASAQQMPAAKYGYRPTAAQMTFSHLVLHVAQANTALCSLISGTPAPPPVALADSDPKDTLVAAIKASFEYCAGALAKVDDSQLGDPVTVGTGSVPRATLMIAIVADLADQSSTASSYLRLNGMQPPAAAAAN